LILNLGVIPAEAGIQFFMLFWTPAFAGVTGGNGISLKIITLRQNRGGQNMQTTVIYSDGQILKTNSILRKWIGSQKKFVAIIEGDSLIIKKPHSLLDFSTEPDENFMTMEEINREIHKARKENEHRR
jgi:hypothetical protein